MSVAVRAWGIVSTAAAVILVLAVFLFGPPAGPPTASSSPAHEIPLSPPPARCSTLVGFAIASSPNPADAGINVSFCAHVPGRGSDYSYSWHFGDGGLSAFSAPVHAYLQPGLYSVLLYANTTTGSSGNGSASLVEAVNTSVQTDFQFLPSSPRVGDQIAFTALPSFGTPSYNVQWTFGDGGSANGVTANHAYASAATYNVTLWVNDTGGGSAQKRFPVPVAPAASAPAFSWTTGTIILVGTTVAAAAVATGGYLYVGRERRRRARAKSSPPPPGEPPSGSDGPGPGARG